MTLKELLMMQGKRPEEIITNVAGRAGGVPGATASPLAASMARPPAEQSLDTAAGLIANREGTRPFWTGDNERVGAPISEEVAGPLRLKWEMQNAAKPLPDVWRGPSYTAGTATPPAERAFNEAQSRALMGTPPPELVKVGAGETLFDPTRKEPAFAVPAETKPDDWIDWGHGQKKNKRTGEIKKVPVKPSEGEAGGPAGAMGKEFRQHIDNLEGLYKSKAMITKGIDPLTMQIIPPEAQEKARAEIDAQIARRQQYLKKMFPDEWKTYAGSEEGTSQGYSSGDWRSFLQ